VVAGCLLESVFAQLCQIVGNMNYGSRGQLLTHFYFFLSGSSLAKPLFYHVSYLRIGKFTLCEFFFEKLDNFRGDIVSCYSSVCLN